MEREMNKFSVVEQSFSRIKMTTGLTEMKTIVNKVDTIYSFIEDI